MDSNYCSFCSLSCPRRKTPLLAQSDSRGLVWNRELSYRILKGFSPNNFPQIFFVFRHWEIFFCPFRLTSIAWNVLNLYRMNSALAQLSTLRVVHPSLLYKQICQNLWVIFDRYLCDICTAVVRFSVLCLIAQALFTWTLCVLFNPQPSAQPECIRS